MSKIYSSRFLLVTMLTYIIFFCLVSVSVTESPSRPEIPDTFVSWFVGTSVNGGSDKVVYDLFGYYAADEKEKSILQNVTVTTDSDKSKSIYFTIVTLFDKESVYTIQWDDETFKTGKCSKSNPAESSYPKIWDWLDNATYTSGDEFMHVDYWGFKDAKILSLLGVSTADSKSPIILNTVNGTLNQTILFVDFADTTPPKGSFDVPSICSKADIVKESFSAYPLIFNSFMSKERSENTITGHGDFENSIRQTVHKIFDKVILKQK